MVHQVPVWSDNLVWLLVCEARGEAAAVDGPEAGPVLEACERLGVRLSTILNTHTHRDHVGINHELGAEALSGMRVIGPRSKRAEIPGLSEAVEDGSEFELFGVKMKAILTEGHIDGHTSYACDGAVFTGDCMFVAGCGYLFDGPPSKMNRSLERLACLPPETLVFCAHEYTQDNLRFAWTVDGENQALADRIRDVWRLRAEGRSTVPTRIELERATNPFVRADQAALRDAALAQFPGRALDSRAEVFAALRELKDGKAYKDLGDTHLPL